MITQKNLNSVVVDYCIRIPIYLIDRLRRAVMDATTIAGLRNLHLVNKRKNKQLNVAFVDIGQLACRYEAVKKEFEIHVKRSIKYVEAIIPVISVKVAPPLPTKPMTESALTIPLPYQKTTSFTNVSVPVSKFLMLRDVAVENLKISHDDTGSHGLEPVKGSCSDSTFVPTLKFRDLELKSIQLFQFAAN
ncbi:hypothetical protein L1987_24033 [Smallanthus sonchifolius]|uniref:Uncharacterized protein n=1 Tax=Smallanthus sonchifolius TaxID=185202 RepID=A0ACB9IKS1_9ASTR|nr:hypothetical protein L1987_24033 [Smallanthus sonchifolius]